MHPYVVEIQQLLASVLEKEAPVLKKVAATIATRIQAGGIVQIFGCGHSHILALEAFYRAGGLVPVRPITIEPLTLQAGATASSKNEKDPMIIEQYAQAFQFNEHDVFLVVSTSGRNCAPIDAAILAKKQGIFTFSLQSLNYRNYETAHAGGKRLEEVVDVAINTHIPVGDGLLHHGGLQYAPASTVVSATILNTLVSMVIEILAENTEPLPVFESANVNGNSSHNADMMQKYAHRILF